MTLYENTHRFAFYTQSVSRMVAERSQDLFQLTDPDLVNRIISVLY